MKKLILLILLLGVFGLYKHGEALYVSATVPSKYDKAYISWVAFNDLNTYRRDNNLGEVTISFELCKMAKQRAYEAQYDWSHDGFQPYVDKVKGMKGLFRENLAKGWDYDELVYAWSISTKGHREAMLAPKVKYACIAKIGRYAALELYEPKKGEIVR
jgi:uncharacterized protein YkwD